MHDRPDMNRRDRHVIAIAGASGAGKSWVADHLQRALGKDATRLSLDDFYRDRSHLPVHRRERVNFDHPRAIDWPLLENALEDWLGGRAAMVPTYDFATHARGGSRELPPRAVLVLDGLWLLRRPALRRLFSLKIFINAPPELCLERRIARDRAERGRSEESVRRQFFGAVLPMYERFIAPQQRWADIVIGHTVSIHDITQLADRIRTLGSRRTGRQGGDSSA